MPPGRWISACSSRARTTPSAPRCSTDGSWQATPSLQGTAARDRHRARAARVEEFIGDKLEEFNERRRRYGGSVWLLEPHLKQGKGGLRDLQAALWIARVRHKVAGLGEAGERGLLPQREVTAARATRDLLWRMRNELHYATGRRDDRLTFDNQRRVAQALGYSDDPGGELGVEKLMRETYIALQEIARASDALIDRCAIEDSPRSALKRVPRPQAIDAAFKIWNGRVTVNDREVFARRPADLVRLYAVAETWGLPVYSYARDLLVQELQRMGPQLADRSRSAPGALAAPGPRGQRRQRLAAAARDGRAGSAVPGDRAAAGAGAAQPVPRVHRRHAHGVRARAHDAAALWGVHRHRAGPDARRPRAAAAARPHARAALPRSGQGARARSLRARRRAGAGVRAAHRARSRRCARRGVAGPRAPAHEPHLAAARSRGRIADRGLRARGGHARAAGDAVPADVRGHVVASRRRTGLAGRRISFAPCTRRRTPPCSPRGWARRSMPARSRREGSGSPIGSLPWRASKRRWRRRS